MICRQPACDREAALATRPACCPRSAKRTGARPRERYVRAIRTCARATELSRRPEQVGGPSASRDMPSPTTFRPGFGFDSSTDRWCAFRRAPWHLLARYFAAEGRQDPIRLVIPRGSYVPSYEECPPTGRACRPMRRKSMRLGDASRPPGDRPGGETSRRRSSPASASAARCGCCGAWSWWPCCWSPSPTHDLVRDRRTANTAAAHEIGAADRGHPRAVVAGRLPTSAWSPKTAMKQRSASPPSSRRPSPASIRWTSSTAICR